MDGYRVVWIGIIFMDLDRLDELVGIGIYQD